MTFRSYPNYDFKYNESLEESSYNASTSYQDKVVLTFTPPISADYILIATAEVQGACVPSYDVKARLCSGASVYQELIYRIQDTSDWYPFCALKRLNLPASSQTFKIQYAISNTNATAKIRNARLYAFSLSGQYAESESESSTTSTSWQNKVTLTFTPPTSGDYLVIATANVGGSSTDWSTYTRLIQDGSIVHAGPIREPSTSGARYTFGVMRKVSLSAASHEFKIQYRTEYSGKTAYIKYAHIVAIRVDQFPNVYYNEDEGESAPANASTWYDKVTKTYTAQAADHLIMGSILYKSGSTSYSVELNLLQGNTTAQEPLIEHKDTTDYETCFMTTKASLSAGSTTDKIQYRGESTSARVKNARLISLQLPNVQYTVEVEFTGSSDTLDWTQLVWVVDSAWTISSVDVTLQLYNYTLNNYSTSGNGYISYTSSATANTDETKSQIITTNPTHFRDGSGNWKIKVKGVKSTATQFDFKGDLIKFEVTMPSVNTPPVLDPIGDKTVDELSTLSFTATASDPEVPPQTLTFSLGPGAPSGASITSGGAFTWTPTEAQGPGSYVIRIIVSDGIDQDYEDITVTVNEVNVAPVLDPIGPKSVNEETTLSFTATASDADIPAQTLTFSLGAGAPSGASITSGGTFTWTPTEAQGPGSYVIRIIVSDSLLEDYEDITVTVYEVNQPPVLNPIGDKTVNEMSTLSFTATASDPDVPPQTLTFSLGSGAPSGASITSDGFFSWTPTEAQGPGSYVVRIIVSDGIAQDYEDITVTVYEVNQPPVLDPVGDKTVNELSTLSFTATASDPDIPAQTLTFSLGAGAPSGASITGGGSFTWTPTEAQGPGIYTIRIIVSDGFAEDYEDITVTVNEVNVAPVLDAIGPKSVNEETTLSFTATATDVDIPAQTLTFSLGPGAPSGASITSGGAFSWTPTEAQGPGVYNVNITVSDGIAIDYEVITVTVNEVNQPPVLDPIGSKSVIEGTTLSFTATATDLDIPAQTLTFSLGAGAPSGASITGGGVFSWTPTEAQGPGSYVIRIIVSDGLLEDYEDVTVTVYEANQPPVLSPIGDKTVDELSTLSFTATASDPDIPPQTLSFSLGPGAPSGASITSGGAFTWTPTEAQGPGVYNVNITVSDGIAIDYEVIKVTVNEVNQPPVLNPIGPKTVNEGTTLSFTATASDADIPAQTLTFSLGPGAPSGASITGGGSFTWTPTEAQGPGSYVIRVIVSDGIAQDYEDITVTVNEVNQPPVLNPIGPRTVSEGNLLQFTVTASDPDIPTQALTYSASNLPPGATFDPNTHVFSWTPTSGQAGVYLGVHFEVSDGYLKDMEDITITVTAPPPPSVGGHMVLIQDMSPTNTGGLQIPVGLMFSIVVIVVAATLLIRRKKEDNKRLSKNLILGKTAQLCRGEEKPKRVPSTESLRMES